MDKNRVIKVFIISIILATTSIAISPSGIALTTFHTIQGTLYVDDEVADSGIEIKLKVGSFETIIETEQPDQEGYNYAAGFDDATYGGMTVHFKVKYKGSFVIPVDNASIVLDKDTENVERYILDLHVNESSPSGDDDDDDDHSGGGGETVSNQPPVADASESQTSGFVDESIDFDGSKSDDPDGTIDLYEWDWDNDGIYDYNSTSTTTTHIFDSAGTYLVTLRVTDNEAATDEDTIEVVISKANRPPTKPTIEGPSEGTKDTNYDYIFQSSDPDNDTIKYMVNWGDGSDGLQTASLPNGTTLSKGHSWTSAGKYTISVLVTDNYDSPSETTNHTVLIDAHIVGGIGYLIDEDADGTYDSFHNDTTGNETDVDKQDDGTYLIDDDGDGSWDYVYDVETDTLTKYGEQTSESDNTTLIIIAIIIIILILIILGYFIKRSNDKKKAAKERSQSKKKNTSKK